MLIINCKLSNLLAQSRLDSHDHVLVVELGGSIARTALALQQVEDSHEFATLHTDGIAHACRLGAAHVDGAGSRTEAMAWQVEIRRVDDGRGIENLLVDLHALYQYE